MLILIQTFNIVQYSSEYTDTDTWALQQYSLHVKFVYVICVQVGSPSYLIRTRVSFHIG